MAATAHFPKGSPVSVFTPESIRRSLPFFVARSLQRDNAGAILDYTGDQALVCLHGGVTLRVPDYLVTRR